MTRSSDVKGMLPGLAVTVLAAAVLRFWGDTAGSIADTYGLVAYGAGLALSWVFYRSRTFIALQCLAVLDVTIVGEPGEEGLTLALLTCLIALVGALGLVRDRGVTSRVGLTQFAVVVALGTVAIVVFSDPRTVDMLTTWPAAAPADQPLWFGFAPLVLLVGIGALASASYSVLRYGGAVERSFWWAVVLLMAALHSSVGVSGTALYVMAAGRTITAGVVETSYVMAYRDELTGLPGRRALMQYLDGIQGTYTIAMVDVDHFKKFNDRHGHDVGDQVLQLVAARLARASGGGKAYRYGGEEFTLLYPGRTREEAAPHLEAVRQSVENVTFALRAWNRPRKKPTDREQKRKSPGRMLSVTVSLGMADTTGKATAPQAVLKAADEALFRAKSRGRNQLSK